MRRNRILAEVKRKALWQFENNGMDPESDHGLLHWEMVGKAAAVLLEESNLDPYIGRLFGLLHDCCRQDEYEDPDHGQRAADFIVSEFSSFALDLSVSQYHLLLDACALHTSNAPSESIIVQCCRDADRLDLGRVDIIPDSRFFALPAVKRLIDGDDTPIRNKAGAIIPFYHGSNYDLTTESRLNPGYSNFGGIIFLTEEFCVAESYGTVLRGVLVAEKPADLTDPLALLRADENLFIELQELAKSMQEERSIAGVHIEEEFDIFLALESGSLYELSPGQNRLVRRVVHRVLNAGYDAVRMYEDGISHVGNNGQQCASWLTREMNTAILSRHDHECT